MFLKQAKRHAKIIIVALSILFLIAILNTDLSPDLYFIHWKPLENISCHYLEAEDVLPSADKVKFSSKSIFFHETSCKGGLDARQACAVESTARSHPDWEINVLFTAPATKDTLINNSVLLGQFQNVNFYRIHVVKYAEDTPLKKFVARGALNRTRWRISHASDVLRYLSLYKWGGVYLDLDVVVAKPLGSLVKNWAARESGIAVAAGAMAFSDDKVGRQVAEAAIRDIKWNYRGDVWGHNGPGVITRVLKNMCSTADVWKMTTATCRGFEVYGPEYFYPIEWQKAHVYFERGHIDMDKAYVYHVWNHFSQHFKIQRGSPYDTLAKTFCPTAYSIFVDEFGGL
ncbi:lactosylceramide 4-alpha-galactosyltransferase-like [Ostrinia furnacalis]|uniref:lactosylceramide 4-alpha-galactosyltransferase-like n=1 Tax=Ostrinia furnacalis TaxID=93504 RepID=UPI001040131E|nr:lactosylceramide 4-alpha-galactosyltransferase-like [Ostrinia furnacalis]